MYQRGRLTVTQKPKNIGWERRLYAVESATGDIDQTLELALSEMEGSIAPVLRMLNDLKSPQKLSVDDTARLMTFVAIQALRTPSARERLRMVDLKHISSAGANPEVVKVIEAHVAKKSWWLNSIGRLSQPLLRALSEKTMSICLNSTTVPFITSDDPVVLVQNEIYPVGDEQAFFQAHVVFPIGSSAMMCFRLPDVLWPRDDRKHRTIEICSADPALVAQFNAALMQRASRFIFACEDSEAIRAAFDRTVADFSRDSFKPVSLPGLTIARRFPPVA